MNEHFINVKVDREERPDVDKVYMSFVQATTGGGGWPMSVFLTPTLKPIFGGTYFPPEDNVSELLMLLIKFIVRCGTYIFKWLYEVFPTNLVKPKASGRL